MPPFARRIGRPGLIGLAARTAVVAGTASAVSGAAARRQASKAREGELADLEREQAVTAPAPAPAAPAGGDDLVARIEQLSQLHSSGVLSDEEFAAAKARVLG